VSLSSHHDRSRRPRLYVVRHGEGNVLVRRPYDQQRGNVVLVRLERVACLGHACVVFPEGQLFFQYEGGSSRIVKGRVAVGLGAAGDRRPEVRRSPGGVGHGAYGDAEGDHRGAEVLRESEGKVASAAGTDQTKGQVRPPFPRKINDIAQVPHSYVGPSGRFLSHAKARRHHSQAQLGQPSRNGRVGVTISEGKNSSVNEEDGRAEGSVLRNQDFDGDGKVVSLDGRGDGSFLFPPWLVYWFPWPLR